MNHRFPKSAKIPSGNLLFVFLVILTGLVFITHQGRASTSVSASLNPSQFSVDDNAVLTVTVNGGRSVNIDMPHVAGLSFQRRGQSSRIQIINGSFSSSISYTYIVQADNPGNYTIPPISISTNGSKLTTAAISFQVTRAGTTLPNQGIGNSPATRLGSGKANKIAFIQLNIEKKKSWVGETIPIQIKAYFRQGIKINGVTLPVLKGDGLVMSQLDQKPPQTEENVAGTDYSVLTWNTTLSAVKEGKHTISLELNATLLLPQRGNPFSGFGDDFFQDKFFQNFFGSFRSKNVKISSRPIAIESKALPIANQPPDFSGAIGHFNLSVKAKPDHVAVGDPITFDMIISGEGNFDRVETPKFPDDPKWKSYPPSSDFKQGDAPTKGRKTFEQALVVKDDRVTEIPSVSFTFFDPTAEKYKTLKSEPIPLTVKKSAPSQTVIAGTSPSAPTAAVSQTEPEHNGIAGLIPIHLEMGHLQKTVVPLFARVWFLAILAACAVVLIAVSGWKLHVRQLEKNPDLRRKKILHDILTRNMTQVKEAARTNDSGLYLAACRKAIQEVLGNCWQTEPSAITLADLQTRLDPSSRLIAIFSAADQVAYARYELSAQQINDYSDYLHKELSELQ